MTPHHYADGIEAKVQDLVIASRTSRREHPIIGRVVELLTPQPAWDCAVQVIWRFYVDSQGWADSILIPDQVSEAAPDLVLASDMVRLRLPAPLLERGDSG